MDEMRVIKQEKVEKAPEAQTPAATNPIAKKMLKFHHEKTKFRVKDIFK